MKANAELVRRHYEAAVGDQDLLDLLRQSIDALDSSPECEAQLAALDHFHARGPAATAELADMAQIRRWARVLDAGSGLGGPSRFLARAFDCSVDGVDLSPAFVRVAAYLARREGLETNVAYQVGDIADLPFERGTFDLVWTEHVLMNVADRSKAYAEFHRVLKTGGRLAFYEPIAAEGAAAPRYPLPWAQTAQDSYLLSESEILRALEQASFVVSTWRDVTAQAASTLAQSSQPTLGRLGLGMVMGPRFGTMAMNFAHNIGEGHMRMAMCVCEKAV